jgi:hypothetical protein
MGDSQGPDVTIHGVRDQTQRGECRDPANWSTCQLPGPATHERPGFHALCSCPQHFDTVGTRNKGTSEFLEMACRYVPRPM